MNQNQGIDMIKASNMLMIGAAGRNVGKTEFACELIRRFAPEHMVVAVKITTVKEQNGQCPRGGRGCGVCSSLKGFFCLTEETELNTGKDTARMKKAGAQKVLWLRVLHQHLREGVTALLKEIPAKACVVCESNSARLAIEPGAFLVIREAGTSSPKDSCVAVLEHADREVQFQKDTWDFQPSQCQFSDDQWFVPIAASGAILAGGQSRRMKQDKSLLQICGHTMLEHIIAQVQPHVEEMLVSANSRDKYSFIGLPVIEDEQTDQGPLMGILSCLQAAKNNRVFITACDIPQIPAAFIRQMLRLASDTDIVMARDDKGRNEPLLAVYSRRLVPAARAILKRGGRRIVELLSESGVQTKFVPIPPGDWYKNLNSPEDWALSANSLEI